jgi:ribosome biogenesis GTPase A
VVLNKIDLLDDRYEIELWKGAFADEGIECVCASGLSGEGVMEVLQQALRLLSDDEDGAQDDKEWRPI